MNNDVGLGMAVFFIVVIGLGILIQVVIIRWVFRITEIVNHLKSIETKLANTETTKKLEEIRGEVTAINVRLEDHLQ